MPAIAVAALIAVAYAPAPEHALDAKELSVHPKVNVFVAESTIPHAGRGVFAARDYVKCELIEEAQSVPLTDAEYPIGAMQQYLFDSQQNDNKTVLVLEHGSLYNHAGTSAQVGYRPGKVGADGPQTFEFYALAPISKGDELFIDYGYEPHPVVHVSSKDLEELDVHMEQSKKKKGKAGPKKAGTKMAKECVDMNTSCSFWAHSANQCAVNPEYMEVNCCSSCSEVGTKGPKKKIAKKKSSKWSKKSSKKSSKKKAMPKTDTDEDGEEESAADSCERLL